MQAARQIACFLMASVSRHSGFAQLSVCSDEYLLNEELAIAGPAQLSTWWDCGRSQLLPRAAHRVGAVLRMQWLPHYVQALLDSVLLFVHTQSANTSLLECLSSVIKLLRARFTVIWPLIPMGHNLPVNSCHACHQPATCGPARLQSYAVAHCGHAGSSDPPIPALAQLRLKPAALLAPQAACALLLACWHLFRLLQ